MNRAAAQTMPKKTTHRIPTSQAEAWFELQRTEGCVSLCHAFLFLEGGMGILTAPIPPIWCAEEPVLDYNDHEIPQDDLTSEDRFVKGWDFAGRLTVIVWKANEDEQSNYPEEYSNR